MTTRPSDRAIAEAFYDFNDVSYDMDFFIDVRTQIIKRAREIDAKPVDANDELWALERIRDGAIRSVRRDEPDAFDHEVAANEGNRYVKYAAWNRREGRG